MSVTAHVLIKAKPDLINELAEAIAELEGVTAVYSVAGRYDLVAIVTAADNEALPDLIGGKIHKLPGIVDSETLIAFRVYRRTDIEAGFSLGA